MDWVLPLLTLTLMEVVLGIDNIIFLSILVSAVPPEKQKSARYLGLGLALGARMGLLLGIKWVMGLSTAVFHWSSIGWMPDGWVDSHHVDAVTGRDLILFFGGIFLMIKAILEIHKKMMGGEEEEVSESARSAKSFGSIIAQIIVLDIVFSLDSVISAVGMVQEVWIMVVAMVVAVAFMAVFAGRISSFIERNPTFKLLALSFLVMIGVVLIAEGLGTHVGKGYIYGSMFFALLVELLNMRVRRKKDAKKGVDATGTGARLSQPPPASA
jgi:predicted tellurium resistance membrane protein TerC